MKPRFQGAKKKFICNDTKTPIDIITQGEVNAGEEKRDFIYFKTCLEIQRSTGDYLGVDESIWEY